TLQRQLPIEGAVERLWYGEDGAKLLVCLDGERQVELSGPTLEERRRLGQVAGCERGEFDLLGDSPGHYFQRRDTLHWATSGGAIQSVVRSPRGIRVATAKGRGWALVAIGAAIHVHNRRLGSLRPLLRRGETGPRIEGLALRAGALLLHTERWTIRLRPGHSPIFGPPDPASLRRESRAGIGAPGHACTLGMLRLRAGDEAIDLRGRPCPPPYAEIVRHGELLAFTDGAELWLHRIDTGARLRLRTRESPRLTLLGLGDDGKVWSPRRPDLSGLRLREPGPILAAALVSAQPSREADTLDRFLDALR
ncbi:MAG: hypothetical protein OEY14_03940, partial [Myxococcales bacterium]|nr:hypothetical protein [Myxococcales bacterium]